MGLTQKDMADRIGVSRATINRFENGENISYKIYMKYLKNINHGKSTNEPN